MRGRNLNWLAFKWKTLSSEK